MQRIDKHTPQPAAENLQRASSFESDNSAISEVRSDPEPCRVGRNNPSLSTLKTLRSAPTSGATGVVEKLEKFYENVDKKQTNGALLASQQPARTFRNPKRNEAIALERRASFLNLQEPLEALPSAISNVFESNNSSTSVREVNAIVTAVKSQIETLNDVALKQARDGQRICPMTLHPEKFDDFLQQNSETLERIVEVCNLPTALRGAAVTPHLADLAHSYFDLSTEYPGAPQSQPHKIEVMVNSQRQSQAKKNLFGNKTVHLSIDSAGLDAFCNKPLPPLDQCEDFQDIFRSHLMKGFEHHPMDQKLAAMYVQLMLHEVSEVQETMGSKSAFKSSHPPAARIAGTNTINEMYYDGSEAVGDQAERNGDVQSQRGVASQVISLIPYIDTSYFNKHGTPLITDTSLRQWVHSAAFHMDCRALLEPSARLLLQRAPINAQALLRTPALRLDAA